MAYRIEDHRLMTLITEASDKVTESFVPFNPSAKLVPPELFGTMLYQEIKARLEDFLNGIDDEE